jgi:hypothetical protein
VAVLAPEVAKAKVVGAAAFTVSVYTVVPTEGPGAGLLSVAATEKLNVPLAVGVPASTPPVNVIPAGSAPEVTV